MSVRRFPGECHAAEFRCSIVQCDLAMLTERVFEMLQVGIANVADEEIVGNQGEVY